MTPTADTPLTLTDAGVALRNRELSSVELTREMLRRADARTGDEPLRAVGTTMPPWPGEDEAILAAGPWTPTVPR